MQRASQHQAVIMSSENTPATTPKKQKIKNPTFRESFAIYGSEFTKKSSLHGVKYLGESKRSIFEKIWWMFVIVGSWTICIGLIICTYRKWVNSTVIVSFGPNPTSIGEIPFPAVTLCPQTKSRQSVFNFTEYYHNILDDPGNMTDEEIELFGQVALVCDNYLYHDGDDAVGTDAIDLLSKVAPEFEEVLWTCRWTNKNETCNELFTPILTEEGICYTFNMLDRDDIFRNEVFHYKDYMKHDRKRNGWTLETGYVESESKDTFPRRALMAGDSDSFTIAFRGFELDLDYICKGPVQGFKIVLHHPYEIPRVSSQYFRLPINQEVVVAVTPDMMRTTDGLISYNSNIRNCYLASERPLRFYKNYTQQNCELECLANYTLQLCGCVAYHMPREESTTICGPGQIICMIEAKVLLAKLSSSIEFKLNCDCLPSCTSLKYKVEVSQVNFDWISLMQAFRADVSNSSGMWISRMTIFFKEQQFIVSERNELFSLTDFLAICGGLLALFLGFSFISAVEIFYFLTLRLFCNVKRYGVR